MLYLSIPQYYSPSFLSTLSMVRCLLKDKENVSKVRFQQTEKGIVILLGFSEDKR